MVVIIYEKMSGGNREIMRFPPFTRPDISNPVFPVYIAHPRFAKN